MAHDGVVEVVVDVAARPATVFRYLSEADGLRAWLGDGTEVEPRPGGGLRVPYPGGPVAVGRIETLEADRRLVFTWGYEGGEHGLSAGASRVEIELEATSTGTRVRLLHHGLPSDALRSGHAHGWRHYLSVLAARSAVSELSASASAAVDAMVAAWNESDAAVRRDLLAASFEESGRFLDPNASLSGRRSLADFIAATRGLVPGARLVRTGEVEQVHDRVRYPWKFEDADGAVLGQGWNFGRLTLEGRFTELVGFWDGPPRH